MAGRRRPSRAWGRARGRRSRGASSPRPPPRPTAGGRGSRAPTRSAGARRRSPAASPSDLADDVPEDPLRAERALEVARDEVVVERLQDRSLRGERTAELGGSAAKHVAQERARPLRDHRPRSGPAIIAHETVRRTIVAAPSLRHWTRARRTLVERWIESVQPQEPRLQIPRKRLQVRSRFRRPKRGESEAVEPVLGFAFEGEAVQQLRRVGKKERRLEVPRSRRKCGAQEIAVAQAEELRPLPPVEADADLAQRLERGAVARLRPPRALGHRAQLSALPREEDDDLARLPEVVRA